MKCTLIVICLFFVAPNAIGDVKFPEPDWVETVSGDELFDKGVVRTVGDTGPLFLMVDASYSAVAPDNGNRRNTQATLTVSINGEPCGWDSYGNEFKTSVAATQVHCSTRGTGPFTIEAKATLWHCCDGGEVHWNGFTDRKSLVKIYAFRAESPAKRATRPVELNHQKPRL